MKDRLDKLNAKSKLIMLEHVYHFDFLRFRRVTNYKLPDMSYGYFLATYNKTPELEISVFEETPLTLELRATIKIKKLNYWTILNKILKVIDPKLTCEFGDFSL